MNIHHKESWEAPAVLDESMSVGRRPIARSIGANSAANSKKFIAPKIKERAKLAINESREASTGSLAELHLPTQAPQRYGASRKFKKKAIAREDSLLNSSIYCGGTTAMSNLSSKIDNS